MSAASKPIGSLWRGVHTLVAAPFWFGPGHKPRSSSGPIVVRDSRQCGRCAGAGRSHRVHEHVGATLEEQPKRVCSVTWEGFMTDQPTTAGQGAPPSQNDPQPTLDGPQDPPHRPPMDFETVFKDHVPQNIEYRDESR